ncbi:putative haloacid dehalogenase-like hydrolase [Plasmodium gaboni]|uniref:Phosphomannomutase n=1 Tax=Plasmodium gaboni TaxID=647221 RepID=A0A151LKP9_9APIC|nr:putative haloacid dehalogenase-like hydrolase [Plasmodium gaboni]XP_028538519.1 haloacid dehalogenase-like hydrolase, putative [Plasmodium sp. gorilla clade G2]SOV22898.1 haloacid dehalogenase-like hydrolase, putative [Plasmodium sp. DRC-Itaito]KYN99553.1 putative haloacid dehalogenase-like hydrolase [Plasmodium gaboni]SOV14831.1 haloacid dehalogenase-like hydrolase, putative [Plasmodium gaboni]SOV14857.1 haloacid dehalogenase-like hydrolase, putative [Plasmodium sp. gorilla clade G2]
MNKKKSIFLFDVDGTLTYSRKTIEQNVVDALLELKSKEGFVLGIVGGSDYEKIREQIKYPEIFDYIFSENGVVAHKNDEQYSAESIVSFLGEDKLKKLINYSLKYIANLDIPKKRGTFIELRNGIINISPIGRNCSQEERDEFSSYNLKNNTIEKFRDNLSKEFEDFDLNFSIGGQISIDCFPKGWDKTFCLRHIENKFDEIYFFGDRTDEGGNDYELFRDKRVKGYKVKSPNNTVEILRENFL